MLGLVLHGLMKYELSLKFLQNALSLTSKYHGATSLKHAHRYVRDIVPLWVHLLLHFITLHLSFAQSSPPCHRVRKQRGIPVCPASWERGIFNIQNSGVVQNAGFCEFISCNMLMTFVPCCTPEGWWEPWQYKRKLGVPEEPHSASCDPSESPQPYL